MRPLVFGMPGSEARAASLARLCEADTGAMNVRRFPDGETYFRLEPDVSGRTVIFVCPLDDPDAKTTPLLMAAATASELGAACVGLVAPYLAYMRQDRRFQPGEPVSARLYADLLSSRFDWLVTVDPHLHRIKDLGEVFSIPTMVAATSPLLAAWICANVPHSVLIGPDIESEQWIAEVARTVGAPYALMQKVRHGDRSVTVNAPDLGAYADRVPVVVDDIVSSGRTLVEAVGQLRAQGLAAPTCLIVHALFGEAQAAALRLLGARVVSVDTVTHPSNGLSADPMLADAIGRMIADVPSRR